MATTWTAEQQNAIYARGGSLLVSAGAGSGKTAVLTERVVQLLFDPEHPVDADRLLIVTYTRAAAQEMKERVARRLSALLEERPASPALRRQLILLERAQISTVHSFCQELIRQNFQRLSISPDFRIADEKELEIWGFEACAQVVEEFYAQGRPAFLELVELLSSGRDDAMLGRTVMRFYSFIRSHPFYEDWLEEKLGYYRNVTRVGDTPWGQILLSEAEQSLTFALERVNQGLRLMEGDDKLTAAYGEALRQYRAQLLPLVETAKERRWDSLREGLGAFVFPAFQRLVKYEDTQRKAQVTACRDAAKDTLGRLATRQFCESEAEFLEDIADLFPKLEELFALTKAYGRALEERKARMHCIDFSDLEHMALGLLMEKGEDGVYRTTPYAAQVAAGFDAVFVDEYQDTNEVQDNIFRAVSRSGENLFLVGDVKQSIYRFRQAMPELFLQKKAAFAPYDGVHYPAKIDLSKNFRSRREVTAGINYLFEQLMTRALGEVDYAAGEQLIPGATYPETGEPGCEVHLLDLSLDDGERDAAQLEAQYVAAQVEELLRSGLTVQSPQGPRPICPGDICLLLRAPRAKALLYREALANRNIQSLADAQRGYLTSREIAAVIALLRAVDNPLLDVELAAAMMSPLLGFTPDEMGVVRNIDHHLPFYLAVTKAAEAGDAHCAQLLALLGELRLAAATLPADQVIVRLYDLTAAEAVFGALEGGDGRRQNLRLLIQHAADYEARGYRGLSGFLRLVERLAERGGDLTESSVVTGGGDSVRIMSIHRSKGLEFPVVFLCDSAKSFNTVDLRQNVLLHSALGFACVRRNHETFQQFTTVPMEALRVDLERAGLSEELRMLYVALTRARERFVITGVVKNPGRKLSGLAGGVEGGPLSPHLVAQGKSYLDWVLMALARHPDGGELRELGGMEQMGPAVAQSRFKILLARPAPKGETEASSATEHTARPDGALLQKLRQNSGFAYPDAPATTLPAKLAISALSQSEGAFVGFRTRPRFLYEAGLTPTERGNALHKFMQFCDYRRAAADVEGELARLLGAGFLSGAEARAVEPERIRRFFASPLARRIFAAEEVHREYRFLAEAGEELLGPYTSLELRGHKTTIQGVADCIFVEGGSGVVVDYKTDHVSSPQELLARYRTQLLLYKELLGEALDKPIKACIIYSFGLGCEIPVE